MNVSDVDEETEQDVLDVRAFVMSFNLQKTLWDLEAKEVLQTFNGHVSAVGAVAFSPNGRLLASGSMNGSIELWNPDTHTKLQTLQHIGHPVEAVAFSHDRKLIALAGGSAVII